MPVCRNTEYAGYDRNNRHQSAVQNREIRYTVGLRIVKQKQCRKCNTRIDGTHHNKTQRKFFCLYQKEAYQIPKAECGG